MGTLWNRIKRVRGTTVKHFHDISMVDLESYFSQKFSYDVLDENELVHSARERSNLSLVTV